MRRVVMLLAIPLAMAACGGTTVTMLDDLGSADGGAGDGGSDGGLKPFGAACSANAECESNLCFIGGNRTFCSLHCTAATQATDCPMPPTSGMCNMQGYCKP